MVTQLPRRGWLALLGLAWALAPSSADAWGSVPMKVDHVFVYRFDVKLGPGAFVRPAAPWYTYFPADPHLMAQPAHNTFPNWPQQFPGASGIQPQGYYPQQEQAPGYWYGR